MKSSSTICRKIEGPRCEASWYAGSTQSVAQRLLGCTLVRCLNGQRRSGIIVEVEAYLSKNDPASHSARGESPRNRSMFEPSGQLYVYSIHSRYCLNVVTEPSGRGSAVLIRAIEPSEGIAQMSASRGAERHESKGAKKTTAHLRYLTSGPARLCEALAVDRSLDRTNLVADSKVWLEYPADVVKSVVWNIRTSPRIGISKGQELPLRWFIDGHQLVSGRASEHSSGRSWRFL